MIVAAAALTSLLLTGSFVQLATRLGWGKSVRQDGPSGHLIKEGTPTMGGVAFLVATFLTWLASGAGTSADYGLLGLIGASALLGLWDDLTALQRKSRAAAGENSSTGALARWRILLQTAIALTFAFYAVQNGHSLIGPPLVDVAAFAFIVVGTINAMNFTDGLDGLAAGVAALGLLLFLSSPVALALLGALLGFLWYNARPARVFMGGVGSEALGAALAGLAILGDITWYLPLVALIPLLEVVSVIIQVSYFRVSGGKRILRMSPLHHHFELSGWSEVQVVFRFWLVTAVCVAIALSMLGGGA